MCKEIYVTSIPYANPIHLIFTTRKLNKVLQHYVEFLILIIFSLCYGSPSCLLLTLGNLCSTCINTKEIGPMTEKSEQDMHMNLLV